MKKRTIRNIALQLIAWLILFQVINISIDPMDPVTDKLGRLTTEEDLSINDIESIYEFISEQVLGVDVPEQDEDDDNSFAKVMDFYFVNSSIKIKPKFEPFEITFRIEEEGLNMVILDHTSPPPKAA